jgi:DnaJ-class molecular chaperone
MADLYTTLGVARGADAAQIKRAYRKLAKELHPDQNRDDPKRAERFKQVTAAYDILSDAGKRGQYDRGEIDEQGNPRMPGGMGGGFAGGFRGGTARPGPGNGGFRDMGGEFEMAGDPSDLFAELFGRAGRGGFRAAPQKGADVAYRLAIPFVDAALARTQRLTLANGRTIDLAVPKGVEDGQQLRLAGQGEAGAAGPGDALVTLMIQSDVRFQRDGADIRTDIAVPLEVAVLGGRQRVPTPDGEVMLTVAPGTSSGKVMRLKAKGWTKKDGSRGDLLARVMVDVPADPALADFLRARASA